MMPRTLHWLAGCTKDHGINLRTVCIMDLGPFAAEILYAEMGGEGTLLCSSFLQVGWTEDNGAEQQQSASAAASSSSVAEQQRSAAAQQQAQDQVEKDQQSEQGAVAALTRDANFDPDLA